MNEILGYRVNSELKSDYDEFITDKYGQKLGIAGNKMEKAMKLYLAIEGSDKYLADPDVKDMLGLVKNVTHTHTKTSSDVSDIERKVDEIAKDFELINEKINGIERKVKGDNNKKTGSMSEFKRQFQMAYHDYSQVSRRDIERFVMNNYDIRDQRSVNNRINFLIAQDVLVPYAQNVYNLQK